MEYWMFEYIERNFPAQLGSFEQIGEEHIENKATHKHTHTFTIINCRINRKIYKKENAILFYYVVSDEQNLHIYSNISKAYLFDHTLQSKYVEEMNCVCRRESKSLKKIGVNINNQIIGKKEKEDKIQHAFQKYECEQQNKVLK